VAEIPERKLVAETLSDVPTACQQGLEAPSLAAEQFSLLSVEAKARGIE
jgi:hypothetical protein